MTNTPLPANAVTIAVTVPPTNPIFREMFARHLRDLDPTITPAAAVAFTFTPADDKDPNVAAVRLLRAAWERAATEYNTCIHCGNPATHYIKRYERPRPLCTRCAQIVYETLLAYDPEVKEPNLPTKLPQTEQE